MNTPKDFLKEDIKAGKPEVRRSPKWHVVRQKHLKEYPVCAACGGKDHLQVHHLKPFHLFPELELESSNLITLCENTVPSDLERDHHHLWLGHSGDFHKNNKNVLKDINSYRKLEKMGKLEGYDGRSLKKKSKG